jgi:hypothetical protein
MRSLVVAIGLLLSFAGPVQAQEAPTRATCEAWIAAQLAQLAPGVASGVVSAWNDHSAENFILPEGCPPLPFPPASPWCTESRCIWAPTVVHTDDGLGYCIWIDWRGMWDCHYPLAS